MFTMNRYRGIAGKFIGGKLYVHVDYSHLVIPEKTLGSAHDLLMQSGRAMDHNVIVWDTRKNVVRFVLCREFDLLAEPEVGRTISVDLDTRVVGPEIEYRQVWHRKYLWVMADYKGFDVSAAEAWAREWHQKIHESPNGSSRNNWFKQLERWGVEVPK